MKNVLFFLLGLFLVVSTGAVTTHTIRAIQPVQPKQIILLNSGNDYVTLKKDMDRYHRKGFVVKTISSDRYNLHVIMEKY